MSKMEFKYPSVLTIAGSDSGGGAGIQADLKTFAALGCYGTSAISAITVQNTLGVNEIFSLPPEIVKGQIRAVMEDIKCEAIKIGMVHHSALAEAIASAIKDFQAPIIFDPVMVASSGDRLIEHQTMDILKSVLFPISTLITPNLEEASALTETNIYTLVDMETAASRLIDQGCKAVLIKGGHLKGPALFDFYLDRQGKQHFFTSTWIDSNNTHGTGCTLSSAIAAFMAMGYKLLLAIEMAKTYVHQAIENGKHVKTGNGHGPLNHSFDPKKMAMVKL